MRKLKVVEFTPTLGLGGTEKVLYEFCKHLDKDKFDVWACAFESVEESGGKQALTDIGIDVRISSKNYLADYLKGLNADIFHIHHGGWGDMGGAIKAAKQAGISIIIEHNVFGRVDTSDENDLIDCHIFVSYSCAARYQMWIGKPLVGPKYEVLYNPLDIDVFDAFGFDGRDYSKRAIGRIGRDDNSKWDFKFLEAIPLAIKEMPDIEFHVIGITPAVKEFFKKNGCEKNLVVHPMTTDTAEIMKFYKEISALTHFAEMGESFGLVLAEAMAAKLPVVTHYTPPPKDSAQAELIDNGYNGIIAQNADQYADAIITLLANPGSGRKLGENGYQKARSCYDVNKITRGLEDIFIHHARLKELID